MWFCYILRNTNGKYKTMTYNGSTNDPIRRLRQHNEEISGGAKATHGKGQSWEIYFLMSGFQDHINTLSCEWRIKHPTGKPGKRDPMYCGVGGRIKGLNEMLSLSKWTSKCMVDNKDQAFTIYIAEDVAHYLDMTKIPENIRVVPVPKITKEMIDGEMGGTGWFPPNPPPSFPYMSTTPSFPHMSTIECPQITNEDGVSFPPVVTFQNE